MWLSRQRWISRDGDDIYQCGFHQPCPKQHLQAPLWPWKDLLGISFARFVVKVLIWRLLWRPSSNRRQSHNFYDSRVPRVPSPLRVTFLSWENIHESINTVRPTTGLFRTVEPNSPRTVYGLPLYRFDLCYIVYMVRNTIFHHDKVLPLGLLRAYGLPDAP